MEVRFSLACASGTGVRYSGPDAGIRGEVAEPLSWIRDSHFGPPISCIPDGRKFLKYFMLPDFPVG